LPAVRPAPGRRGDGAARNPSARRPPAPPRAITVHALADALAALEAATALGRPVSLLSAPGAAAYAGAGWFRALVDLARRRWPQAAATAMLDCGDRAELAQGALRVGLCDIVFTGRAGEAARLADIAGQQGARLHRRRPPALELAAAGDAAAACRAWLGRD
jgi:hypothetical protein